MKKSFLLLSTCLVAGITNAQYAQNSIVFNNTDSHAPSKMRHLSTENNTHPSVNYVQSATEQTFPKRAARTTSGGGRWYNYVDFLMTPYEQSLSKDVSYYSYMMWNDTTASIGYTAPAPPYYDNNAVLSVGLGLDPTYTSTVVPGLGWNTADGATITDFTGAIAVTAADAYTVDSVFVAGWYIRNYSTPAKSAVVDTLILAFVESGRTSGDLPGATYSSPPAAYGVAVLGYQELYHDIANNRAAHNGGGSVTSYYKILLTGADTNSNSNAGNQYPRPGGTDPVISFAVPANHIMAMSATFKSGDASYPVGGDIIRTSSGTAITGYPYNNFQVQGNYAVTSTGGTTVDWPLYDSRNMASGYWEEAGSGWGPPINKYYPNWDIITGTPSSPGPAEAQFPRIAYHITCSTCGLVGNTTLGVSSVIGENSVSAYPNPATGELNIVFSLTKIANTVVTLTNMVGQVVAQQHVNNTASGKAVFNTSELPAGVYIYTLQANGERSTGRVVVAH